MFKETKIFTKILVVFVLVIILLSFALTFSAYIQSRGVIVGNLQETLTGLAEEGGKLANSDLAYHLAILEGIANRNVIRSMVWEQQKAAMLDEIERTDFIGMAIMDRSGIAHYPDDSKLDLSDRAYFQRAVRGETNISDIIISRVTHSAVFIVAAPIFGEQDIAGVLMARLPGTFLTDITDELGYGDSGHAFVVDSNGTVISHHNRELIMDQVNFIQEASSDDDMEAIAGFVSQMTSLEKGSDSYSYLGIDYIGGFAPIYGTGWSMAVAVEADELYSPINYLLKSMILIAIIALIISSLIALYLGLGISKQIKKVITETKDLINSIIIGDLRKRGDPLSVSIDFSEVIVSINDLIDTFVVPFKMIAEYIDRISKGNLPPEITKDYEGDFNEVKRNLNNCIKTIEMLLSDTNKLSDAVIHGRLDHRIDITTHQGDFKEIVSEINGILHETVDFIGLVPSPVIIIDREFRVEYMNQKSLETVGKNRNAAIGMNFFDLFMTDDRKTEKCAIVRCFETLETESGETYARVNNKEIFIAYTGTPIRDLEKTVVGAIIIITDLSEIKKSEVIQLKRTGYIDEQVGKVIQNLDMISKGDFDIDLALKESDEHTDDLKKDFHSINNSMIIMRDLIKRVSECIEEYIRLTDMGELKKIKFETEGFSGEYLNIIEGLNRAGKLTSDAITEYIAIAINLENGELSKKIEGDYKGGFLKMKNCLNVVIDNLIAMQGEYLKIDKSVELGDLSVRGDAKMIKSSLDFTAESVDLSEKEFSKGAYYTMIGVINHILESIVEPVREISEVMDDLSHKKLTSRVKGDYKGDLNELKDDVNTAGKMLEESLSQVDMAVDQIQSAVGEITSGSQALAEGASEQASSIEEIASSLEEISSIAANNSKNANEGKLLAHEADDAVNSGNQGMEKMTGAMMKITKSSEQTSKIIKTIDEIAFQTNLLALNAAVEAAHAGEAGKGFAVVAEEVKNLALRSAEAARNTSDLIEESIKNSELGKKIVDEVTQSFTRIKESFGKVNNIVNEVSASSEEQTRGINQVNVAITELNKLTQQNAANAEESASAAEEMNSQSAELKNMVSEFELRKSYRVNSRSDIKNRIKDSSAKSKDDNKKPLRAYEVDPEKVLPMEDMKEDDFEKF